MNPDKIEKIGNVTLDLTYYPGEDLYSEGEAEDKLLEIVSEHYEEDYDKIIQQTRSWSVMYHLSHVRENIISWIPFKTTDKILEIGAGCGAITGALAEACDTLTCVELSKKRSTINATRHKTLDNVTILVGNFKDIEPHLEKYDYITLIGVFEYAQSYMNSSDAYTLFLDLCKRHLAPGGKLVISLENQMGLKYFAGCKEDHLGRYYAGLEGYSKEDGVKTFSKDKLERMITDAGLYPRFYYPYPDYKLPHTIYSDDSLPGVGDLNTNLRNLDNDRIVLFDEEKVFDTIIKDGKFPYFSNSFLVIASNEADWVKHEDVAVYAKYANERIDKFKISTKLVRSPDGVVHVYKNALEPKGNEHIKAMSDRYENLIEQYAGVGMTPVKIDFKEAVEKKPLIVGVPARATSMAEMEYAGGLSLEKYLNKLEEARDFSRIIAIIKSYCDKLNKIAGMTAFKSSWKFEEIFGKRVFEKQYKAINPANFDMIFSNIMIDSNMLENGEWKIIDYEWILECPVPLVFIIYRALFYQFGNKKNSRLNRFLESKGTDIYRLCGISKDERLMFESMEQAFQMYVIGGVASLEVMQVLMPSATIFMDNLIEKASNLRNLDTPEIFFSHTKVFLPDSRINLIAKVVDGIISMRIPVDEYVSSIRIDPTEYPCICYIHYIRAVTENGTWDDVDSAVINGYTISKRGILFDTNDAQIIIFNLSNEVQSLEVSYSITMVDELFYKELLAVVKEKEQRQKEDMENVTYKAKRRVGMIKPELLPDGFKKIDLSKDKRHNE